LQIKYHTHSLYAKNTSFSLFIFLTMASRSRKRISDDFIDEDEPPRTKKAKNNAASRSGGLSRREDANGESYWEISKMRRVTISTFRGKTMVNIREYYEKDGQELPGKKVCSFLMLTN
jgi:hypothetical protein